MKHPDEKTWNSIAMLRNNDHFRNFLGWLKNLYEEGKETLVDSRNEGNDPSTKWECVAIKKILTCVEMSDEQRKRILAETNKEQDRIRHQYNIDY